MSDRHPPPVPTPNGAHPPWPPQAPPGEGPEASKPEVAWTGSDLLLSLVVGVGLTVALLFAVGFIYGLLEGPDAAAGSGGFAFFSLAGSLVYLAFSISFWLLILRRRKVGLTHVGFRPVGAGAVLWMIPVALGCLFANGVISTIVGRIAGGDVPDVGDQLGAGDEAISSGDLIWLLVATAIVAPLVEELFFRGLLYPWLRSKRGVGLATGVSALLFALIHFIPLLIPSLFFLGVVLALVTERYDSIVPAIALHALVNATSVSILYLVLQAA